MTEVKPINIDLALAVSQLEANPELAQRMNELVMGKVAAQALADADQAIKTLTSALVTAYENLEEAGNMFEDRRHGDAWEYLAVARLQAKTALKSIGYEVAS